MGSEDDPKRVQILEASFTLFAQYGFKKTTIGDIAKAVHIGKATVYSYFENKEAIFAAVLDGIIAEHSRKAQQAMSAAATHEDKLRAWAATLVDFMKEVIEDAAPLTDEALFELLPMAQACREKYERREVALLEQVIAEATADGTFHVKDPRGAATALIVAMRGIDPLHRRFFDPPNLEKPMKEIVEWFIRGFKAPVETK
jgi:AcrR family transcriptional regulator